MADTTQFGHDQLGHLLADYLLEVPRFQRSYAWDSGNVEEYLSDLEAAQDKDVDYFMGTVVFARPDKGNGRRQIVDGQQRLATTAILLIAIRDELRRHGRVRQADEIEKRFLRGYVIAADDDLERLILSPNDVVAYGRLLDSELDEIDDGSALKQSYQTCVRRLQKICAGKAETPRLIALSQQLEERVQVLVAEATDLPEAYVIFETLNDRGADLTTADLLKNYLFSSAKDYFSAVEVRWAQLEANFERPADLVKFIRYEHASRNGPITGRKLYRAIQAEVAGKPGAAKKYVQSLIDAQIVYLALRDPESDYWSGLHVDVRDAVYAYRRFGFEASIPVLLAAFARWKKTDAAKLLVKLAKWSVRAQFSGRLGGGVADETFGDAAKGISDGTLNNQSSVRQALSRLIPSDPEFQEAFRSYGDITTARAKYLLAMLEKAHDESQGREPKALEWHSRSVTIEHILPLSQAGSSEANSAAVNRLGNMALLEKRLNKDAGSKDFKDKRAVYKSSAFGLTVKLASKRGWKPESVTARTKELAELACRAWPGA